MLDVALAAAELFDFPWIFIETNRCNPSLPEGMHQRQTDIAEPHHADTDALWRKFRLELCHGNLATNGGLRSWALCS